RNVLRGMEKHSGMFVLLAARAARGRGHPEVPQCCQERWRDGGLKLSVPIGPESSNLRVWDRSNHVKPIDASICLVPVDRVAAEQPFRPKIVGVRRKMHD